MKTRPRGGEVMILSHTLWSLYRSFLEFLTKGGTFLGIFVHNGGFQITILRTIWEKELFLENINIIRGIPLCTPHMEVSTPPPPPPRNNA